MKHSRLHRAMSSRRREEKEENKKKVENNNCINLIPNERAKTHEIQMFGTNWENHRLCRHLHSLCCNTRKREREMWSKRSWKTSNDFSGTVCICLMRTSRGNSRRFCYKFYSDDDVSFVAFRNDAYIVEEISNIKGVKRKIDTEL